MKKILYFLMLSAFVLLMIVIGFVVQGCDKDIDSIVNNDNQKNSSYSNTMKPSTNPDTLIGGFIRGYNQGIFMVDTMNNGYPEDPRYWSVKIYHCERGLKILDLFDESWFSSYMGLWPTQVYGGYAPLNNSLPKNNDYFFIANYYDGGAKFIVFFIPAGSRTVEQLKFPNNVYLGGAIVDIKQSKLNPRYYLLIKYYYWNNSTCYYSFDAVTREIKFLGY